MFESQVGQHFCGLVFGGEATFLQSSFCRGREIMDMDLYLCCSMALPTHTSLSSSLRRGCQRLAGWLWQKLSIQDSQSSDQGPSLQSGEFLRSRIPQAETDQNFLLPIQGTFTGPSLHPVLGEPRCVPQLLRAEIRDCSHCFLCGVLYQLPRRW